MLKSLRSTALPALISTAASTNQMTMDPIQRLTVSIARDSASSGFIDNGGRGLVVVTGSRRALHASVKQREVYPQVVAAKAQPVHALAAVQYPLDGGAPPLRRRQIARRARLRRSPGNISAVP